MDVALEWHHDFARAERVRVLHALERLAGVELLVGLGDRVHVVQRRVAVDDLDRLADLRAERRAARSGSPSGRARPGPTARGTAGCRGRPSRRRRRSGARRRRRRRPIHRWRPRPAARSSGRSPCAAPRGFGGVPSNVTLPVTLPAVAGIHGIGHRRARRLPAPPISLRAAAARRLPASGSSISPAITATCTHGVSCTSPNR